MTQSVLLVNPLFAPTQTELEANYHVHRLWEADDPSALLASVANDVRGIVTDGGSGASAELMRQLPNTEVVSVFGGGSGFGRSGLLQGAGHKGRQYP